MGAIEFIEYQSREKLAEALANTVVEKLETDMEIGDFASLALSGGSTPKLFLNKLAKKLGAMREMVYFALVDERFVPLDDERSNEKMIRQELGLFDHPSSEFLSLFEKNSTPEDVAKRAQARLLDDDEIPFDVLVLGMGIDGHTASLFPNADKLSSATNPDSQIMFEAISAPGAGEPRITMTIPLITSALYLVLHIEGAEKRAVFEKAMEGGNADDLPIRHVLHHPDAHVHVYWAP